MSRRNVGFSILNYQREILTELPTVLEALRCGREIISDPSNWIKDEIRIGDKSCLGNACIRGVFQGDDNKGIDNGKLIPFYKPLYDQLPKKFQKPIPFEHGSVLAEDALEASIAAFNDHPETTHEMVLSVFDRAIFALEEEEATKQVIDQDFPELSQIISESAPISS